MSHITIVLGLCITACKRNIRILQIEEFCCSCSIRPSLVPSAQCPVPVLESELVRLGHGVNCLVRHSAKKVLFVASRLPGTRCRQPYVPDLSKQGISIQTNGYDRQG